MSNETSIEKLLDEAVERWPKTWEPYNLRETLARIVEPLAEELKSYRKVGGAAGTVMQEQLQRIAVLEREKREERIAGRKEGAWARIQDVKTLKDRAEALQKANSVLQTSYDLVAEERDKAETSVRHWREECGKLNARANGATEYKKRWEEAEQQKDEWATLFTDANHRLKEAETALKRLIEPHFDEDGVVEIFSASTIVGVDRNGKLQLKGSFIAALEAARATLPKSAPA